MTGHGPTFQIIFLFHDNLALLRRTLPQCLAALTEGTEETFEVVLHCDGTPAHVADQLPAIFAALELDELRIRRRSKHVSSGDPSNNGHRRFFDTATPYVVVIEDDVVAFRTDPAFDALRAIRRLFEQLADVPVIFTVADHWQWSWPLQDVGPELAGGVRSVNRVSTHLIAYAVQRFVPTAQRFGAFEPDVFVDRDDLSYNWEDVVSHVATTGGRRIAFPEAWPLKVFHCDRKVADGSIHHTRDPQLKAAVLNELVGQFAPESALEATAARP
jgi:hypothetical protein